MKKYGLFLLVFISAFHLNAQGFYEWSVGGEGTALTLQYSAADKSGLVVVGESHPLNMIQTTPRFLQSGDEESSLDGYYLVQERQWVLFFDQQGKLTKELAVNLNYNRIHGVLVNDIEEVVLLMEIGEVDYTEDDESMGYLPRFTYRDREPVKSGFHFVYLSRKGDFLKSISASTINFEELEILNFQLHPNGSFVLAGAADSGRPVLTKEEEVLGGGGDFVMIVDTSGHVEWLDIISYRENSCCSRTSQNTSLSISPDGTIYFGGSYLTGGVFSNGLHTLVPSKYSKNNTSNFGAYVVSYQQSGKINWVKPYEAQSYLFALHGNKNGVYVSHQTRGSVAFGTPVDTSGAKFNGLSLIDKKGKVKWTQMSNSLKAKLISEVNDQVILLQTDEKFDFNKKLKIGKTELPERTRMLISSIDVKQNQTVLKSTNIELESRNDPILFSRDLQGNIYLGGTIFCGFSIGLKKIESSLPAIDCYGATPVIGKILLE